MKRAGGSRLTEIVSEVRGKGYFARAQDRAARRKSAWNLLLFPIGLCSMALAGYALLRLAWGIRNLVFAAHAVPFGAVVRSNVRGLLPLLFFIPPVLACIPLGLFITNVLLWCIRPARRVLDQEAVGVWHASFIDAQQDMLLAMLCISCPAFLVSVAAALFLRV